MPKELEAKFKLESADTARILMHNIEMQGGHKFSERIETNQVFDTPSRKLDKAGLVVRIRKNKFIWPRATKDECVITFKGKQSKGQLKNREELEYTVVSGHGQNARKVFEALGFHLNLEFQKRRISYKLRNCIVEIDRIPKLGFFCEVEGPSERSIERVMTLIGFGGAKLIQKGYGALIREHMKAKKSEQISLRF